MTEPRLVREMEDLKRMMKDLVLAAIQIGDSDLAKENTVALVSISKQLALLKKED